MAWIARLLARWTSDILLADNRELRAQLKQKDSEIALLKAEVEFLTEWRAKELARLRKEADIARTASVLSHEMTERE